MKETILNVVNDPVFLELKSQFPETSPEAIETLFQLQKVMSFMNIKREAVFSAHGLTSGRFHLLMILKREPNRNLSPSELAKRTNVSRGTMTQFVDAIEKDGFAVRIDDPNDKRGMLVQLTDKGVEVLNKVLPDYLKLIEKITKVLTPEDRRNWLCIMEKLVAGLSEIDT